MTNPGAAGTTQFFLQYDASLRDADQDSYENSLDTCPLIKNVGDQRAAQGPANGDADSDGIDNACDGVAPYPSATPNAGNTDQDGDGYFNRGDDCPQISNAGGPGFQQERELSNVAPAADNGPNTDGVGDLCDTGTLSVNQNNNNHAGTNPSPAPAISITMSDTVANGRYMTATNLVAKCIGTAANDADGDGYCTGQDGFDAATGHNAAKHNAWAGATHPALQMDTDGDKLFDTQETWMSQCVTAYVPPAPAATCGVGTASASLFPTPPPKGVANSYTLGADSAKSCAQTTIAKDEGPWDNWGYDFNDDGLVSGGDFLVFAAPFGKTVDLGLVNNTGNGSGWTPVARYDLTNDGLVSGGDFLAMAPVFGKTCGTGAPLNIPPFSQQ